MATLKKRTGVSRVRLPEAMPLTMALDTSPHVWAAMTERQFSAARALRVAIDGACVGTRFDPRHVLTLTSTAIAVWRSGRLAWVQEQFAEGI